MNLHAAVRGAISTVNPDITISLKRSTGYATAGDGTRTATFSTTTGPAQVQHASGKDLEHVNGLNLQGVFRSVYLYGNWTGVVRVDQKGGDVLQFPEVTGGAVRDWMVVNVAETYPDWCRVIVWLQA